MWEAIAVILTAASLAGTGIAAWVNSSKQTALNKQAGEYQKRELDSLRSHVNHVESKLEKRIDELEAEIVRELKELREVMHKIDLKVTEIANKK